MYFFVLFKDIAYRGLRRDFIYLSIGRYRVRVYLALWVDYTLLVGVFILVFIEYFTYHPPPKLGRIYQAPVTS